MKKSFILLSIASLLVIGCSKDDEVTFEEQLAIDLAIIDKYLADNEIDAQIHESEIRYQMTQEGDGEVPAIGDPIVAKFKGFLLNGNEFAESKYGNTFTLDASIIQAWSLMLPEMKEGGKMTIYTPSGYAFGPGGNSLIAPNSILIFEIELLRVIDGPQAQFAADTTIIEEFLLDNEIDAIVHPTGIRYTVENVGIGNSPDRSDQVVAAYQGFFLEGGSFDSNPDGALFALSNVIEAWQIILPEMKEGGKVTIYSPSRYCYGENGDGRGVILSNTVLGFDIELIRVQ